MTSPDSSKELHPLREILGDEDWKYTDKPARIEALIALAVQAKLKSTLDTLIDKEIELYKIYGDDDKICVGIKIMADEVREFYDDATLTNNQEKIK